MRGYTLSLLTAALLAVPAMAQQSTAAAPNAAPQQQPKITNTETVVVTAPGEVRVEQEIAAPTLIEEAPGTSPIKALSELPSVNFQAADPYGSYEWAVRISVRGFNQNQLGFTLDDIPLGDMSYSNWNGLHISRAITDENIGRVVMSQGTGALETASNSNLGGTIQFYSSDPGDKRSAELTQSFGSYNAYRTYVRYDSGLIGGSSKFYLSGAYNLANKWRGHGQIDQNYWQINAKYVHYVGADGVLSLFGDVSDRREVDYQDVNKVWVQKLGYNWDNFGNWAQSVQAAYACDGVAPYPAPVSGLGPNDDACDAGYYGGAGLRKDVLGGVSYKQALSSHLTMKTTAYGHRNDGRGLWFTPYVPTYNNIYTDSVVAFTSPISERTSEYAITRGGVLTSLAFEKGHNKLEGGFWFEGSRWNLARRYYATSVTAPMHSLYSFPSNPFLTQWEYVFNTTVYSAHVQDVYHVNDNLTISGGFKLNETTTDGELSAAFLSHPPVMTDAKLQAGLGYTPGTYAQGQLTSGKPFLPQFGFNYKLNGRGEVFADAAYNVRAYQPGGYGFGNSPWGTTQAGFTSLSKVLKPETAWTEEAGYRFSNQHVQVQASYFHVNYNDRLLAFQQGPGIAGGASAIGNAGGVTSNGVDGSVSYRLTPEWTLYNAFTYNRATYDSNVQVYNAKTASYTTQNTAGKLNVDTPETLYKNSLEYHKAGFFGRFGTDYMGQRYFTFSNDGAVGGRFITEFGMGYNREQLGAFKDVKAQFNISNLMNSQYYASIGTNGFVYSDPQSVANNTLQVGAPRTLSGTVSVRF